MAAVRRAYLTTGRPPAYLKLSRDAYLMLKEETQTPAYEELPHYDGLEIHVVPALEGTVVAPG